MIMFALHSLLGKKKYSSITSGGTAGRLGRERLFGDTPSDSYGPGASCIGVCACVRACVRACVCVCVHPTCVREQLSEEV